MFTRGLVCFFTLLSLYKPATWLALAQETPPGTAASPNEITNDPSRPLSGLWCLQATTDNIGNVPTISSPDGTPRSATDTAPESCRVESNVFRFLPTSAAKGGPTVYFHLFHPASGRFLVSARIGLQQPAPTSVDFGSDSANDGPWRWSSLTEGCLFHPRFGRYLSTRFSSSGLSTATGLCTRFRAIPYVLGLTAALQTLPQGYEPPANRSTADAGSEYVVGSLVPSNATTTVPATAPTDAFFLVPCPSVDEPSFLGAASHLYPPLSAGFCPNSPHRQCLADLFDSSCSTFHVLPAANGGGTIAITALPSARPPPPLCVTFNSTRSKPSQYWPTTAHIRLSDDCHQGAPVVSNGTIRVQWFSAAHVESVTYQRTIARCTSLSVSVPQAPTAVGSSPPALRIELPENATLSVHTLEAHASCSEPCLWDSCRDAYAAAGCTATMCDLAHDAVPPERAGGYCDACTRHAFRLEGFYLPSLAIYALCLVGIIGTFAVAAAGGIAHLTAQYLFSLFKTISVAWFLVLTLRGAVILLSGAPVCGILREGDCLESPTSALGSWSLYVNLVLYVTALVAGAVFDVYAARRTDAVMQQEWAEEEEKQRKFNTTQRGNQEERVTPVPLALVIAAALLPYVFYPAVAILQSIPQNAQCVFNACYDLQLLMSRIVPIMFFAIAAVSIIWGLLFGWRSIG